MTEPGDPKIYAETAKIIDELLRRWVADIRNLLDRKSAGTAGEAKDNLAELRFGQSGFRNPISKIASGKYTRAEMEELGRLLQNTAGEVGTILSRLEEEHRGFLDKRYGSGFWNRLDKDVAEVKLNIRHKIERLAQSKSAKDVKVGLADEIKRDIEKFNEDLSLFCDIISPPKIAATS
jgi:hypothetical protein